jgi:hypothetical protein
MVIDHYSKSYEAKSIVDHDAKTTARYLEDGTICRFGVPKYFIDNNFKWYVEFDHLCKSYGIVHQYTSINGQGVMGWWKDWSKLSNVDSQFCLPILSMHKIGTNTYP